MTKTPSKMKTYTKYFIRFYYQGILFYETKTIEVDNIDIDSVKIDDNSLFFDYFSIDYIEKNGKVFESEPCESEKTYFHPDSYIESADEFLKNELIHLKIKRRIKLENAKNVLHIRKECGFITYDENKHVILKNNNQNNGY